MHFAPVRWLVKRPTVLPMSAPSRSRFGDYRKDDPDSFQLRPQLSYYPQFMFNFRRSQFIQVGPPVRGVCLVRRLSCHSLVRSNRRRWGCSSWLAPAARAI